MNAINLQLAHLRTDNSMFCSQILSSYVGTSSKSGSAPLPRCFPDIPSYKFAYRSEWNASRFKT